MQMPALYSSKGGAKGNWFLRCVLLSMLLLIAQAFEALVCVQMAAFIEKYFETNIGSLSKLPDLTRIAFLLSGLHQDHCYFASTIFLALQFGLWWTLGSQKMCLIIKVYSALLVSIAVITMFGMLLPIGSLTGPLQGTYKDVIPHPS